MSAAQPRLSLTRDQRRSLLKGLSGSLVVSEKLVTTRPKAKLLVPYFERLITVAKKQNLAGFRRLRAQLPTEQIARKLYDDIAPRFSKVNGGYTRIKRVGWQQGDNTPLVEVSLTAQSVQKPSSAAKKTPSKSMSTPKAQTAPKAKDKK